MKKVKDCTKVVKPSSHTDKGEIRYPSHIRSRLIKILRKDIGSVAVLRFRSGLLRGFNRMYTKKVDKKSVRPHSHNGGLTPNQKEAAFMIS